MNKQLVLSGNNLKKLKTLIGDNTLALEYISTLEKKRDKKSFRKRNSKNTSNTTKRIGAELASKKFREDLVKKQTPSEKKFKAILKSVGLEYEFQKPYIFKDNSFYIVDFYIPSLNIAIEIDGGYHTKDNQKYLDKKRTQRLVGSGWIKKVYRFTNTEVETDAEGCRDRLNRINK